MVDLRGSYQLQLIDPGGAQLDLLSMDRVVALDYTRALNDIGTISFTLDESDDAAQYFGLTDMLVNVWRKNTPTGVFELDASYLIRFWSRLEDSEDTLEEFVVFGGVSLEHFLKRRVIVPEDDPVSAGGFVARQASGDTLMRDFVTYQCITPVVNLSRSISGLSAIPVTGGFAISFQRRSLDRLLDVLQEIAQKTMVDFEIAYTGDTETETMALEFRAAPIGTDRTKATNYPTAPFLLFDPRRGNMFAPVITVDRKDEATFIYVAGQGLEDERVVFPVSNAQTINDSIWNRIESVTDARNNEEGDLDGYLGAGIDALNDAKVNVNFEFQPDINAPSARYNVDFFLGDKVSAQYAGYTTDVRIAKVNISLSDDETIEIELINLNVL